MPSTRGSLKWLTAILLAGAALTLLLAAAERWLWRPPTAGLSAPPPASPPGWLTILPPPLEIAPADRPAPPPVRERRRPTVAEAPWWQFAWQQHLTDQVGAGVGTVPRAAVDSTRLFLARIGLEPELAVRARPDSALAARLIWLTRREGLLPAEVRPLLRALSRAEAYRAIAAQAATLYDEFLAQEIITPD